MLVLSRVTGQSIDIDGDIKITVIEIRGNKVRLGIEAPKHRPITRDDAIVKTPVPPECVLPRRGGA